MLFIKAARNFIYNQLSLHYIFVELEVFIIILVLSKFNLKQAKRNLVLLNEYL